MRLYGCHVRSQVSPLTSIDLNWRPLWSVTLLLRVTNIRPEHAAHFSLLLILQNWIQICQLVFRPWTLSHICFSDSYRNLIGSFYLHAWHWLTKNLSWLFIDWNFVGRRSLLTWHASFMYELVFQGLFHVFRVWAWLMSSLIYWQRHSCQGALSCCTSQKWTWNCHCLRRPILHPRQVSRLWLTSPWPRLHASEAASSLPTITHINRCHPYLRLPSRQRLSCDGGFCHGWATISLWLFYWEGHLLVLRDKYIRWLILPWLCSSI